MAKAAPPRRRPLTARQQQVLPVGGQYLARPPLAMAHRGGARYGPNEGHENSLRAFANAVDLGFEYIETDVRTSSDGEVFCFHDPDLTRMADQEGLFEELSAAQIRSLSLRGGEPIPTLAEALAAFPQVRFNIDVKSDRAVAPTIAVLDAAQAYRRVLIGAFSDARLRRLRRARPQAATSTSPRESVGFRWGAGALTTRGARAGALCLQVPTTYKGQRVLTPRAVDLAHAQNMQVHVWTIDDADTMHDLYDMGVDAIITDRIDVLKDVLVQRGQWPGPRHANQVR